MQYVLCRPCIYINILLCTQKQVLSRNIKQRHTGLLCKRKMKIKSKEGKCWPGMSRSRGQQLQYIGVYQIRCINPIHQPEPSSTTHDHPFTGPYRNKSSFRTTQLFATRIFSSLLIVFFISSFFFFFFGPLSIVILAAHFSFTKIQHLSVVIFDFWILSLDAPATWPTLAHLSLQVTRKSPARSSFPLHSTSPHHVANTPKTV